VSLKVGEIYVALNANISGFAKGMGEALDSLGKVSKAVSRASRDIAQIGLGVGAALTAAANHAAKFDSTVGHAVENTRKQFNALSVEVGRAAVPIIREFNDAIGNVVRMIRQMDPALKRQIMSFAEFAVKVGAGALILSKLTGALGGVLEVASKLMPLFGGAFLPFLAAAGAAVLLAGAFYKAWNDPANGLKDTFLALADVVKGAFEAVSKYLTGWIDYQLKSISSLFDLLSKAAHLVGKDNLSLNFQAAREMFKPEQAHKFFAEGAADFERDMLDVASKFGGALKDAVSYSADGLKQMMSDAAKALGVSKLGGGSGGAVSSVGGDIVDPDTLKQVSLGLEYGTATAANATGGRAEANGFDPTGVLQTGRCATSARTSRSPGRRSGAFGDHARESARQDEGRGRDHREPHR
jgi:hypothetical protein